MSLDLIMGYTGMVSFGHAAYFGLGAYGSALLLIHWGPPVPLALLAGALLAAVIAAPVAWFSTRATGIDFAMLTLAFAQLLYTVAYKWRDLTGGSDGIAGVPKTALFLGGRARPLRPRSISWSPRASRCRSRLAAHSCGHRLAGPSRPFARMSGASPAWARYHGRSRSRSSSSPRFSGGLAGALFAPFRGFASPEVMFWVLSGQALMMIITGGIGTLIGPVIGAMVFILIQEVLSSYTEHWMIFAGLVFVLMVIFLPGGLVGTARRWLEARGPA